MAIQIYMRLKPGLNCQPQEIKRVQKNQQKEKKEYDTQYRSVDLEYYEKNKFAQELKNKLTIEQIKEIQLRNKLKSGELLEKEFVTNLFKRFVIANSNAFHTSADNYVIEICEKLQAEKEITAKFRAKLKELINKSIETAQYEAKKEIESVIKSMQSE